METISFSKKQVKEADRNFVYNVDKLYRMYGGLSSKLVSIHEGVASLELRITERWKKEAEETARQIVNNRLSFDERLKEVILWRVRVYDFREMERESIPDKKEQKFRFLRFLFQNKRMTNSIKNGKHRPEKI